MSMIDIDPPSFQSPRPIAGDDGNRRTVLYGDYTVFSVFQPVFSVSHRRAIGYHASLRAHDSQGNQVPSHDVFTQAARRGDLLELGRLAESLHLGNFHTFDSHDEWLFLSLHPAALMDTVYGDALLANLKALGLPPQRVVLEVPEQAGGETPRFAAIVDGLRKAGFLIALGGFGAKHSNIDRVWHLHPDIVTLDRGILAQASEHSHLERVLPGLVSLLHESGQLVLMGGITTEREALIALECDVDFVQGQYFAGPSVEPVQPQVAAGIMDTLSAALRLRVAERSRAQEARLAPYVAALLQASALLREGRDLTEASKELLELPEAARCFLLDASGRQIGDNVLPRVRASQRAKRFSPLMHSEGASWERRPYFIEAMRVPGRVHFTPPYLSINEAHLCVTASIATPAAQGMQVLCVDINWEAAAHRD
ncbi:EAL domain-containing protein [Burkholderia thailandensis]|uniref:EAL domain protein n=1 Tax=Burkholderia thailandensis (strain ATCC 700388 / DSM 13276 / CCUG 48851 / CIP 106301 / E264) TaxID=271848 RepID=Q2T0J2_BURTA|nr:EAL domain-containing protein [Burkholderia thailandensis]ABC36428.1 EAL domain protein [Burkholderia thailandensis E264]AHI73295.1 EAL domain protein [Burkholderia thailandensis 2002721723]AHI77340.1 EAL domain protein [Burkholderia thailandensis E444]AIC88098.1 EAL domain protein [Burkholderia thailandensis USAMRU Malaysia \